MATIDPASKIREHMEVVGADGVHVGRVDAVEGSLIKLTRNDPASGGDHHFLHVDTVDVVESDTVRLTLTAGQAHDEWMVANAEGRAVGGRGGGAMGGGGGALGGGIAGADPRNSDPQRPRGGHD